MKCYNHSEKDIVAICKACGKALCHECAVETGTGIACSPQCTEALLERKALFGELATHLRNTKRAGFLSALFSLGMGILFIYFSNLGSGFVYDFILILGVGFTVYGILALLVNMIAFFKHREKQNGR